MSESPAASNNASQKGSPTLRRSSGAPTLGIREVRTAARALSALILVMLVIFLINSALQRPSGHRVPGHLSAGEIAFLVIMFAEMIGLALAWKWEGVGGSIALIASIINYPQFLSPLLLIPVTALLFLLSRWLRRRAARDEKAQTEPPP